MRIKISAIEEFFDHPEFNNFESLLRKAAWAVFAERKPGLVLKATIEPRLLVRPITRENISKDGVRDKHIIPINITVRHAESTVHNGSLAIQDENLSKIFVSLIWGVFQDETLVRCPRCWSKSEGSKSSGSAIGDEYRGNAHVVLQLVSELHPKNSEANPEAFMRTCKELLHST